MSARELEFKFAAPRAAVEAAFGERLAGAELKDLRAVYFDTPSFDLRRKDLSLRLRCEAGRWVQTLKQGPGSVSRREDETAASGPRLQLERLSDQALQSHLTALKDDLRPVFETHVRRKVFILESGGARIEAAFDEGEVRAGAERDEISELELELKAGSAAALIEAARRVAATPGFRLALATKASRGYALAGGHDNGAVAFRYPALSPKMSAQEGLQGLISATLTHFEANASRAAADTTPETVHQARVALRRLRVFIGAFPDVLADDALASVEQTLRRLGEVTADARSLDVFAAETFRPYVGHEPGAAALGAALLVAREQARERLRARFAAAELNQALLDLIDWSLDGAWTRDPLTVAAGERPLSKAAAQALGHRLKVMTKRGLRLDWHDPLARHKLRIQAKKARYLVEAFPFAAADFPVAMLKGLQDGLGELNDIAVAGAALDLVRRENPRDPDLTFAAGLAIGRRQAGVAKLIKRSRRAFEAFTEALKAGALT